MGGMRGFGAPERDSAKGPDISGFGFSFQLVQLMGCCSRATELSVATRTSTEAIAAGKALPAGRKI